MNGKTTYDVVVLEHYHHPSKISENIRKETAAFAAFTVWLD